MFVSLRIATLVCIGLGAGLLASPRRARAELPGGATIEFDGPFIHDGDEETLTRGNAETLKDYFNAAHCECARSVADFNERSFAWDFTLKNRTEQIPHPGDIWVGAECDSDDGTKRMTNCSMVDTIDEIDSIYNRTTRREISLFDLMQPLPGQTTCPVRAGETATWILVDSDGNGAYDSSATKTLSFDTQPPNRPTGVTASPGEGSVVLSWTNPTERQTDTKYYYFLCALADQPALAKPSHGAEFETPKSLCGATATIEFNSTGDDVAVPAWLKGDNLNAFVCGRVGSTSTGTRIKNLRAGLPYSIAMIAVDDARNPIGLFVPETVTPTSVIDFWEDLHDQGGDAEGGLCLLATTYGDDSDINRTLRSFRDDTLARSGFGRWMIARYYQLSDAVAPAVHGWALRALAAVVLAPLVAAALLWHFLTLPGCALLALALVGWRRRRQLLERLEAWQASRTGKTGRVGKTSRAAIAAAALALVAAWAGTSSAQTSLDPYWADEDAASTEDPYAVHWHAGIRLGPYTPAIDKQFGADPGPYEQMFGGYAVMPMLDVDYIFMQTGLGQLGAGGSIGFMTKSAETYVMDSLPGTDRPRTEEENTFRMVPMAATMVFRLTALDDKFRVPIIPYVRGGLAYYFWWTEAPDGGVSSVCREGGDTCDENKGRGGSLGVVGSLGLAVRAEKIDFEAASAMREGGIQHAGFYAEVQAGKVDDFGTGNKLSVGDITWFAGVDFEF